MRLKGPKKFSFIITMLVTLLTLFCMFSKIDISYAEGEKITNIVIEKYEHDLKPAFDPEIHEYTINISYYDADLNVIFNSNSLFEKITGNRHLTKSTGDIKIYLQNSDTPDYTITYNKVKLNPKYEFAYTGAEKTFTLPISGYYKLEVWGGQGGTANASYHGGYGGYSKGVFKGEESNIIYINVGGTGGNGANNGKAGGYNGGGYGQSAYSGAYYGSGGGATHMALSTGLLSTFSSKRSDLLIAAGGGGGSWYQTSGYSILYTGGNGGGYIGAPAVGKSNVSAYTTATGGSQSSGGIMGSYNTKITTTSGTFGTGGNRNGNCGSGGGGGYFGGAGANCSAGGGGSGYIANDKLITYENVEKSMYCYDCSTSTYETTKTYTNKLVNANAISEYSKTGTGYAIISPLNLLSDDNYLTNLKSDYGTFDKAFDPLVDEYSLTLDKYDDHFTLSATLSDDTASIIGLKKYYINANASYDIELAVTSESGNIKIYTIHVHRNTIEEGEHSSKLSKLEIKGYESDLNPWFHSATYEYNITISGSEIDLDVIAIPYDEEANVVITGNKRITDDIEDIYITVTEPHEEPTTYKITYTKQKITTPFVFGYTGAESVFTIPISGMYKIELWGGQGGTANASYHGGYGGYSKGVYRGTFGEKLYINVGGVGSNGVSNLKNGGYNGGGKGQSVANVAYHASGGGATSITKSSGLLSTFANKREDIISVAGGGGGSWYQTSGYSILYTGGNGGGYIGAPAVGKSNVSTYTTATGGSQSSGGIMGSYNTKITTASGTFGTGGPGNADCGSGGGGGFFGGAGAICSAGGGGSGYISPTNLLSYENIEKSMYCYDCTPSTDENTKTYTNKLVNANPVENNSKTGTGYARITILDQQSKDNYLNQLIVTNPKNQVEYDLSPEFDPIVLEYRVRVPVDDTKVKIQARPSSDLSVINGLGEYEVLAGENEYEISVTSESGNIRIYKVIVEREASTISTAKRIVLTGLVENICNEHKGYCKLDNDYNENIHYYSMIVPAGIRDIEFTVEKSHYYQEIIGDGVTRLLPGENEITIEIRSEDKNHIDTYTYEIIRDMTGNNYIDTLEVVNPSIDIGFNFLIQEYSFKVENDVEDIELEVTLDDPEATYEIKKPDSLIVGNNIVEIEVTAKNGEVRSYILNVFRVSNSNSLLESLKVSDVNTEYMLSPEFKDIKMNYVLNVINDVKQLKVEAKAQASTTTVNGVGTYDLRVGTNEIKIITTAENGETQIYKIIVNREKNRNNYLSYLSADEGDLNPDFERNIEDYFIDLDPYTKSLTIKALPEVSTSKVSISGNGNFKIGPNKVTIRVISEYGEAREYNIIANKAGSNNNYLKSLTVDKGVLSPEFDKEITKYEVSLPNEIDNISISGAKEDILATLIGPGTYRLGTGHTIIKLKVTSETGLIKEYEIDVYREKNADGDLKDIRLSSGNLNKEVTRLETDYEVNVENDVNEIRIEGIPYQKTTKVEGNGLYKLQVGENEIKLKTISEIGIEKEYTIIVTRDESSNANLSYLAVREGKIKPTFDKMTTSYEVKVRNEIQDITVNFETEKETSTVQVIKPEILDVGENEVSVVVTAEDGSIKIYKINVIRLEETDSNLDLRILDVTSCPIFFDKDKTYYECEVKNNVNEVTITAEAEDTENTTVEGQGKYQLKVGKNLIGVVVKDSDGNEKSYQVEITRAKSIETRLKNLKVDGHLLKEAFNKDKYLYTLETKEQGLNVLYEKLEEHEEVEIKGNTGLILGENIIEIKVTSEDKEHSSIYKITVTKLKNDNNYLRNIMLDKGTLSPNFNKGVNTYIVRLPFEESYIEVEGITDSEDATLYGNGVYNLFVGENEVLLKVVAEDLTERVYEIIVVREGNRNNYLSSLEVMEGSFKEDFERERKEYSLEVEYEVSEITINATTEDEHATISGIGKVELKQGQNKIPVTVTSENGDLRVYYINVLRKDPKTGYLKNIEVRNYRLEEEFESKKLEYNVIIDYEVENIDLIINKLDPQSTYVIEGNTNLEVGINEVRIISTSSDGKEVITYKLYVTRQSYSNTYLKSLTVSSGELDFEKTTLSYQMEVENSVSEIEVIGVPENTTSTVKGNGKYQLKVGKNDIVVTVLSTTGIKRSYLLTVNRKVSNNANVKRITSTKGQVTKQDDENYKLVVGKDLKEITDLDIKVETEDNLSQVIKPEKVNLEETMDYKFKVISPDNTVEKEYTIHIEYEKSTDARLKSLSTSKGELSPAFNKDRNEYRVQVRDIDTEIEIDFEKNDEYAEVITTKKVYELNDYETVIEIITQAEAGNIETYIIAVEKGITTTKTLDNIVIKRVEEKCESCLVPEFDKTTYDYSMTVPYDVKYMELEITKEHKNQEVSIYKNDVEVQNVLELDVGQNEIVVEVINSVGDKTRYTYNIERLKNKNNYLKSLRLLSPDKEITDFDKEKLEYNVQVGYEYENINIEAIAEDEENAKVSIQGTTYLIEGNNDVIIKVRSQEGETRVYVVHVLRTPESNNLLQTLTVSSGEIYILNPKFQSGIQEYTLRVPSVVNRVQVEGVPVLESTRVEGEGLHDLRIGINKIELKAISLDGAERTYKVIITRESGKNVYLEKLEIQNGVLQEEFSKEKGLYQVNIANTESRLIMNIEPEDKNATYEVIGNENLTYGKNIVKIKVTSSDKSASKTYVLEVNKEGSSDALLKDLKVNKETIEDFSPQTMSYTIETENINESIEIEGIANSEYAKVEGNGKIALQEGDNEIEIKVIAQNGNEKIYTIKAKRKANCYLSNLITDAFGQDIDFEKTKNSYEINVENEKDEITVIGLAESKEAKVEGNGKYKLKVGENLIPIKVVNNEYENVYTLKVIREGSSNTYLKYLTVLEGEISPEFSKENETYSVHIPNDLTKINVDAIPEDESSKVEIIGNINVGEEVLVKVTSTNKSERIYTIKVFKEEESFFSNKLISLKVSKGSLSPRFDKDEQSYTVTVPKDVTGITIEAEAESEEATIEGDGLHKLETGRNVIPIKVTSQDKKVRIYTVIVYRSDVSDARISKLEFNEGYFTISFNKNIYDYILKVGKNTKYVTIKELKTVEETATYKIEGNIILTGNDDEVRIVVTSADKSDEKTYRIKIEKEVTSNTRLKYIRTSEGEITPEFDPEKRMYEVEVSEDVRSIIVSAEAEDEDSIVSGIGKIELEKGKNVANIIVSATNGSISTYTVVIKRGLNSNNLLSMLEVKGYDIGFTEDTLEYSLEVEDDSVVVVAIPKEPTSTVIGDGIINLKMGLNEVKVLVTSEDGSVRTYKLNITRKLEETAKLLDLYIDEGVFKTTFNKDVNEYYVTIPNEYEKVTVNYIKESENAQVDILGNSNLKVGENIVKVHVTNGDKENEYIIHVIKYYASNNYLKGLTISEGTLIPEFDKEKQKYEIHVGNNVEEIEVNGIPELNTSTVIGNGIKQLKTGENIIVITVESESGYEREYQIRVIREKSNNTNLEYLITNKGELTYNEENGVYEIEVEEGLDDIYVEGKPEDENAQITGNGTYKLKPGINEISLLVTADNGDIKVYKIEVKRRINSNLNILNISTLDGVIQEEFDNARNEYTIVVKKNINVIDVNVKPESPLTIVLNNEKIKVDEKTHTIILQAEDGQTRELNITMIKEEDVEDIILETDDVIDLLEGEETQILAHVIPEEAIDKTIKYEVENNDILDIDQDGKVRAKRSGETKIVLTSNANTSIVKKIDVNVIPNKIRSKQYEIKETDYGKIMIGIKEETDIEDFLDNIENDKKYIKIEKIIDDEIVTTGMKVRLEKDGTVYDEVIVIVRGDINQDGIIDISDKVDLQNHILNIEKITGYKLYAADVDIDESVEIDSSIDISDNVKLGNYILNISGVTLN